MLGLEREAERLRDPNMQRFLQQVRGFPGGKQEDRQDGKTFQQAPGQVQPAAIRELIAQYQQIWRELFHRIPGCASFAEHGNGIAGRAAESAQEGM